MYSIVMRATRVINHSCKIPRNFNRSNTLIPSYTSIQQIHNQTGIIKTYNTDIIMLKATSNLKADQEEIIKNINACIEKNMIPISDKIIKISNDKTIGMSVYELIIMNKKVIKLKLFSNSVKDNFTGFSILILASSFSYCVVISHIKDREDI